MIKRFVTRRVEIDAMQFDGENHEELNEWTDGRWDSNHPVRNDFGEPTPFRGYIHDDLHETWISVAPGMWIVRGAKGEFYPCDGETFHWKYEEVNG